MVHFPFLIFFLITPRTFESNDIHSVITYNIKYDDNSNGENSWNVRKVALLELITTFSPNIIGIQEGLIHQVEFLNSKMNDHKYVGVGRDDGYRKGEYCAIFFNEKKYITFSLILLAFLFALYFVWALAANIQKKALKQQFKKRIGQ